MFAIFLAELRYTYRVLLPVVVLIVLLYTAYYQLSNEDDGLHIIFFSLSIATILQLIILRSMEKRDRLLAILPLPNRQIALSRILLYALPCGFYYGLFFLLYGVASIFGMHIANDLFDELMFAGVVLLGFSCFFIVHDLASHMSFASLRKQADLFALVLLVTVALIGIPILIAPIEVERAQFLQALCFAAGLLSMLMAKIAFERRKSYLES